MAGTPANRTPRPSAIVGWVKMASRSQCMQNWRALRAPGAFAHRPNSRRRRLQTFVHLDVAAQVQFDSGALQTDAARIRRASGGDEQVTSLDLSFTGRRAQPNSHLVFRATIDGYTM